MISFGKENIDLPERMVVSIQSAGRARVTWLRAGTQGGGEVKPEIDCIADLLGGTLGQLEQVLVVREDVIEGGVIIILGPSLGYLERGTLGYYLFIFTVISKYILYMCHPGPQGAPKFHMRGRGGQEIIQITCHLGKIFEN